jgi:hypothetical protein
VLPAGLEPAACGLGIHRSIHLSYGSHSIFQKLTRHPCPLPSPLWGKLWGLFRQGLQDTDRPLLVITGEVPVPECHTDVLMSHQGLHRSQIDTAHNQLTRKGVVQVMEGKILHTRLAYRMRKCCAEGSI